MVEEEVDGRCAFRCCAETFDGKHSGLVEIRNRYDGSDCGAEEDLDVVADRAVGCWRHDSRAGAADCDYGGVPYSAQAWHHQAQGAQACGKACRDYCAFRAGEGVECRW